MKKIGFGLQFNVYDLGNGKVLKTYRTKLQMYLTNLLWEPYLIFVPWILKKKIDCAKKDRNFSVNYFKENNYKNLVANLEFKEKKILQDKVIPLKHLIKRDFKENKEIIDKYIGSIISCWKKGFADKIYNFTVNNGLDKDKNVILMDFGEITTNKEDVEKAITSKRWEKAGCYKRKISGKIKKYYREKMQETLTLEQLNKSWKN